MASLMQSSAMSSTFRHQLSSLTLPTSSSVKCIRALSALGTPKRRLQERTGTQLSFQLNSPKSFLPAQQSRTFLAKLTRKSPAAGHATRTASPSVDVPASQTPAPPLQLTNLPYFVRRTSSNQLPVYLVTKAGGTKQLTKIQRTEGDLEALRTDLGRALGLECRKSKKINDVTINQLNGHIIVKGWRKPEIQKFLLERNF